MADYRVQSERMIDVMTKKVLIIGGTGVFGKRLVRHLASCDKLELHVSSRSINSAKSFVDTLTNQGGPVHPIQLDTHTNFRQTLDDLRPFIVVDCSGPFQGSGYDCARTVLQAGAHYVDLSDARDFLAGFSHCLDPIARESSVAALAGASSSPTLSTCVVKDVTDGWKRIDSIDICITPGGRSEVGRSVIEAILSYAGKSVPLWDDGHLRSVPGWQNSRRVEVPELGFRRVAPVETYDAEYLGEKFNVQSRVSFSAGLESRIEQRGIEAVAFLRSHRLLKSLKFLVPILLSARKITRIPTSSSGGMMVKVSGSDADGIATGLTWSLVAHQDHGPFIPILPAAAAVKKLLNNEVAPGARFAHSAVQLSDIVREMCTYDIKTMISFDRMNS